jgi:hypothetical protein
MAWSNVPPFTEKYFRNSPQPSRQTNLVTRAHKCYNSVLLRDKKRVEMEEKNLVRRIESRLVAAGKLYRSCPEGLTD